MKTNMDIDWYHRYLIDDDSLSLIIIRHLSYISDSSGIMTQVVNVVHVDGRQCSNILIT